MTVMQTEFIDALTSKYAGAVQAASTRRVNRIAHSVRSMADIFDVLRESESAWRGDIYSGKASYQFDEDAAFVRVYRHWAVAAKEILDGCESLASHDTPIPGVRRLGIRFRLVESFINEPPARLIDQARVGLELEVRRKPIKIQPLSEYLAKHPEKAERATHAAECDEADAVLLSDFLASRKP